MKYLALWCHYFLGVHVGTSFIIFHVYCFLVIQHIPKRIAIIHGLKFLGEKVTSYMVFRCSVILYHDITMKHYVHVTRIDQSAIAG